MTDKKVAVVTGGSRGIGRATALHFANAGFVSVSASRSEPPPARQQIHHIATDVALEESVSELVARVVEAYGGIDVLVNCAGIEVEGTVETTSPSDWRRVFDVNAFGTFLCSRAALPHLRERGGAIVNVSSIDGHWAEPGLAAYCASKGAVIALTRAMAIDHAGEGVRCNCVCPGYVATEMLEQFFVSQPDPEAARSAADAMHPIGRVATSGDVADVIVWLAGEGARYVTGQVVSVDGGLTAGRGPSVG